MKKIQDAKHDNWYDEFRGALRELSNAQKVAVYFVIFLSIILGIVIGIFI